MRALESEDLTFEDTPEMVISDESDEMSMQRAEKHHILGGPVTLSWLPVQHLHTRLDIEKSTHSIVHVHTQLRVPPRAVDVLRKWPNGDASFPVRTSNVSRSPLFTSPSPPPSLTVYAIPNLI